MICQSENIRIRDALRRIGRKGLPDYGIAVIVLALLWTATSRADEGEVSNDVLSTRDLPGLGENRLFTSAVHRSFLDKRGVAKPLPAEVVPPASEPPSKSTTDAKVITTYKKRMITLNGVVMQPDGSVDVWVNGSNISKQRYPDIDVIRAERTGPVLLHSHGRRYELYPGQRVHITEVSRQVIP